MLILELALGLAFGVALIPVAFAVLEVFKLGVLFIWRVGTHPMTIIFVVMCLLSWLLGPHALPMR